MQGKRILGGVCCAEHELYQPLTWEAQDTEEESHVEVVVSDS